MVWKRQGDSMVTAQKTYAMLNNETLWNVAARCSRVLTEGGIAYSVCGGVAVCLHGYRRNTVDLDLVVRREDSARARKLLEVVQVCGAVGEPQRLTSRLVGAHENE